MLATVISFCTNDVRFLKPCIEGVAPFSSQIIIPVCDHFFDGTLENLSLLEQIYADYPEIEFIEFAFDAEQLYGTFISHLPLSPGWGPQWHNSGRLIASYFLNEKIDDVLFCDVDEIFEPKKMGEWLEAFDLASFEAIRFSTYWYFREACFQATTYPDGPLLVKKEKLTPELILNEDERMGMFCALQGKKVRLQAGIDGAPMVHHFSWVRTKEEMLKKAASWGHQWERNWKELIEEEFSREFKGVDFVRKYEYKKVEPFFDALKEVSAPYPIISLEEHRKRIASLSHVKTITAKQLFRKEILKTYVF